MKRIQYVGVGTSTFQSDPLPRDEKGSFKLASDWNYWVSRRRLAKETLPQLSKHFPDYVAFLERLGVNMFRFSLEPDLVLRPGTFDECVMKRYVQQMALLRLHGIEPFLTLNHYTMPFDSTGISGKNGEIVQNAWELRGARGYFHFLVDNVTRFLADDDKVRAVLQDMQLDAKEQDRLIANGLVRHFMTINEPMAVIGHGNVIGIFPPHRKGRVDIALIVLQKLVAAHDIAYELLKGMAYRKGWSVHVGIGHNWQYHQGFGSSFFRGIEHFVADKFERDGTHTDFVGLQYYCWMDDLWRGKRPDTYGRYLDWGDVYPEGIRKTLERMHQRYPGKPLWVTEFGFSDERDLRRPWWILETMRHIDVASREGVPVEGVLLWTLAHNFEWNRGMQEHFGLRAEAELTQPLGAGEYNPMSIRSESAFHAVAQAMLHPSPEGDKLLDDANRRALRQFKMASEK